MGTSTSAFGVGKRESHDATDFYARFAPPVISDDDTLGNPGRVDTIHVGDARDMSQVPDASVALVVTSPPYFAGKEYETALGEGHVPADYIEYLDMLRDVLRECLRTLEPGGRLVVNVANLGRKPYRSLAADVTTILQDDLRMLLRGEVVWQKQRGASGSCAWGSYQSPANPVLRDTTERLIIASKGRFDRVGRGDDGRGGDGRATIPGDEFMEATLDVWELPAESATRVGHPAPFPVALVERCLHLFTYEGDVVLDPFMGSGTTAVAAKRTGRRYVGYDTDGAYVRQAQARVDSLAPTDLPDRRTVKEMARTLLTECGFTTLEDNARIAPGVTVSVRARRDDGVEQLVEFGGVHTPARPGMARIENVWKTIAKASILRESDPSASLVVVTSGTVRGGALATVTGPGKPIAAVIDMTLDDAFDRLNRAVADAHEYRDRSGASGVG
ncbi:MAG: DNA-methyltransferase [Ilumatobacter sp.]|jgi:DNA modification methylase|uniref:DNA-methyltransferase n=1 Tax=Ilumatobacter sp. TaxID=1967498 RepID=UPI00391D5936